MMDGAIIRSMKYQGNIPRGSVVVFANESTVKLPAGTSSDKLCGVYSQYKNEDTGSAATGKAIPITVQGPAKACAGEAVEAGDPAYIKATDTSGETYKTKATDSRLIGRFLEDGAEDDYVLMLVQMGE